MDKQTLSNYGWVVIVTLILAVMLALATPFGTYVGDAVVSVANGFVGTSNEAIDEDNISKLEDKWANKLGNADGTPTSELPAKGKTLEQYTWAEVKSIVSNGKATEYGFAVGGTKTLSINGATKTATIVGLNHDGSNTATFMILSSGGIGYQYMNPYDEELGYDTNEGGWKDSAMREWLATDIYNSMTDVKDYIKPVTKLTNNIGYNGNTVSETSDTVFLLSPKECGIEWQMADNNYWASPDYVGIDALNAEGTTYEWFANGGYIDDDYFWLRSPRSNCDYGFFFYDYGDLDSSNAYNEHTVCPAFVIG